jgi:HSP20 family protein
MNYVTVRRPRNGMSMVSEFDRLFDSVFSQMPNWNDRKPAVDIRNEENRYVIEADLPGMSEDQIDVRVENDLLVLQAKTEEKTEEKVANDNATIEGSVGEYILRERSARTFYRSFALPKDANTGSIEAHYRNGVLTLSIAKKEEARPRQIEIKRD